MPKKRYYTEDIKVRIKSETREKLEKIAEALDSDMSKVIRDILEEYLA